MKELLLADAIGNIDDRLVEEYIVMKAESQKKRFSLKGITSKWALAAASFFLAIIIGTGVFLGIIIGGEEGIDLLQVYREGTLVKSSAGNITLTDADYQNKTFTFVLEKKNNTPLYIKFEGYIILDTHFDENGATLHKVQHVDVITDYDRYKSNGHIVLDIPFKMTVNGEEMEAIPREPGVYEITVDYSNLCNVLDDVSSLVEVRTFGKFLIS